MKPAVKKLLVFLACFPFFVYLHALVLVLLWGWFAVPLGVPPLSMAHALGLGLLVAYVWHTTKDQRSSGPPKEDGPSYAELVGAPLARMGAAVLFGWLITLLPGMPS